MHGKIHNSGLLFGYAADRCTKPDWYVLPDGHQPNAWKLLHAARKGGDRFCVGSGPRYALGQAGDAANKAKDYQFESLHKIYFYDAWRWKIELNQPESPLRLPPQPGLLQNGCYWQHPPERTDDATHSQNAQESAVRAEISLTETSSAESEENIPPSEVPEPASQVHATESPTSPITIGSTEEERVGSQKNATEPSEEASPVETIASASEENTAQEGRTVATPTSPATKTAAKATEQRELTEGEQAEETESSTTDEVIDLDDSTEAIPAHTASSSNETKVMAPAQTAQHSLRRMPATWEATTTRDTAGKKRPASTAPCEDAEDQWDPSESARTAANAGLESTGGHPCGRPLASPSKASTISIPTGEAKRRNRWVSSSSLSSPASRSGPGQ